MDLLAPLHYWVILASMACHARAVNAALYSYVRACTVKWPERCITLRVRR